MATRGVIFFGYEAFVSDVPFYHHVFKMGILKGFSAYCDFWFPYPPLSLPLMYGPGFFGQDYGAYRRAFQLQMLVFDVAAFFLLNAFLKNRIKCPPWLRAGALSLYSLLGLFEGHLLLDRLDIGMSVCYLGALYYFTAEGRARWAGYAFLLAGALVKLLPLFMLPLFAIFECYRARGETWPSPRSLWLPFVLVAVPFAAAVLYYNNDVCDQVLQSLSQHGARGIQIESNWAIPLVANRILNGSPVQVDFSYGAFDIFGAGVPAWFVWVSKRAGFLFLGGYYLWLFRSFRRKMVETSHLEPIEICYLFYGVILILICTQRVLSPQYLIWMLPLAAIQFAVAERKAAVVVGSAAVFGLSYVVFDKGFHRIIDFDPTYSLYLVIRNVTLLVWAADILRRGTRALRLRRRTALQTLLP